MRQLLSFFLDSFSFCSFSVRFDSLWLPGTLYHSRSCVSGRVWCVWACQTIEITPPYSLIFTESKKNFLFCYIYIKLSREDWFRFLDEGKIEAQTFTSQEEKNIQSFLMIHICICAHLHSVWLVPRRNFKMFALLNSAN